MPKHPLENNKTTQKASKRVSGGWLPAALQITRLAESLSAIAESCSIISSSLISSAGEGWILTCKRLSTMGNKLIISNQIFHIARGGGELISDRSRISPQPVNPFAPAEKLSAHSHCLGHRLFSWFCCLTRWIRMLRSASFCLLYYCVNTVSISKHTLHVHIWGWILQSTMSLNKTCAAPLNKVHCLAHSTSFHLCN